MIPYKSFGGDLIENTMKQQFEHFFRMCAGVLFVAINQLPQ